MSLLLPGEGIPSFSSSGQDAFVRIIDNPRRTGPNDNVQIACIGMGIMGYNDTDAAIKVPGVKLVAACDLYTGRLQRAKEVYGSDPFTTRDYREILNRKDIDAVIVATSDNWHARIATAALESGRPFTVRSRWSIGSARGCR